MMSGSLTSHSNNSSSSNSSLHASSPMSEYFKTDKNYYAAQVAYMFKEQLYSSVLNFGSIALSMASKFSEIMTETQEVSMLMMCGDSAFATNDYVLAESYYRKVLQLYKSLSKSLPNLKEVLPDDCSNDVKYKLYLCYMHFKKPRDALAMLQSIPAKSRTVRTNLALGRLYMQNGMERAAITSFKEVLRECPTAMEAIESLIALGMKETDLQVFFTHRISKMPHSEWFYQWVKGQQLLATRDYSQSIQTYDQLHDEYSLQHNHYLLYTMANIYVLTGDYENAIGALQQCHLREPSNMNGMDLLAFLLWWQAEVKELERLSRRLSELNYNENRPEAWIAMAYTAQLNGRGQKGTSFATRAASCSSNRNLEAHICRGYLLLDAKKITEATDCFREAIQLNGNRFEPHNGLVTCYLEMKRYREASAIANFAMKKLGQTPRVLTMCSQPLCKDPLNFAKAKTYLENALQLDPNFEPAVLQLSEILEMESNYERAIQYISTLLENGLRTDTGRVSLHNRLGHLWVKSSNEERAMDHFAIALRIDPNNREARDGLSRLDPATNRSAVHETTQAASFELVDEVEIDEEDDEQDLAEIESELEASLWGPQQGDF